MERPEPVKTALRVLTAWSFGNKESASDAAILRQDALPHEAALPLDELACLVVNRECSKAVSESCKERQHGIPRGVRHWPNKTGAERSRNQ